MRGTLGTKREEFRHMVGLLENKVRKSLVSEKFQTTVPAHSGNTSPTAEPSGVLG